MTKTRTTSEKSANRQREATLRWLAKPGVSDAQREKAKERSARNRAQSQRKANVERRTALQKSSRLSRPSNAVRSHPPGDILDLENDDMSSPDSQESSSDSSTFPPLPNIPLMTLPYLRSEVREWQIGWGPETLWGKLFSDDVRCCEHHVKRGRILLGHLRSFIQSPRNQKQPDIIDQFIQAYDLSMELLSELRFFELKLDEYAPAVSSECLSEARYYDTM
ncbi:hypothetical protein BJ138DRAFT_1106432 [Hygrophoropsis aurantiaca]|uniref:Uncharacterized protein n=1 Tax=Hygrophoropsis aurantiaca TaxID=72124 RepID=A0ACB7ZVV7_9AGAM|nr:hypothetical protein BJ138DRAFT_1106432 [Hygrophoropsis aurantiaca]